MEQRLEEQVRTQLTAVETLVDESHANITLRLRNDGQTPVADFGADGRGGRSTSRSRARDTRAGYRYTSGALQSNTWTW